MSVSYISFLQVSITKGSVRCIYEYCYLKKLDMRMVLNRFNMTSSLINSLHFWRHKLFLLVGLALNIFSYVVYSAQNSNFQFNFQKVCNIVLQRFKKGLSIIRDKYVCLYCKISCPMKYVKSLKS